MTETQHTTGICGCSFMFFPSLYIFLSNPLSFSVLICGRRKWVSLQICRWGSWVWRERSGFGFRSEQELRCLAAFELHRRFGDQVRTSITTTFAASLSLPLSSSLLHLSHALSVSQWVWIQTHKHINQTHQQPHPQSQTQHPDPSNPTASPTTSPTKKEMKEEEDPDTVVAVAGFGRENDVDCWWRKGWWWSCSRGRGIWVESGGTGRGLRIWKKKGVSGFLKFGVVVQGFLCF